MKIILKILVVVSVLAVGYVFWHFNPAETRILPDCMFHSLSGLYCPTCGAQRSLHQLLHLNFLSSLRNNLFLLPVMLFAVYRAAFSVPGNKTRMKPTKPLFRKKWLWILLALVLVYTVLRNIREHPFTLLAPE